ncbi:hypothetical protein [Aurantibacter sp.]|uniref:hypothetical protein n=1 Tax=Aurantibacter sp. TaxID=2807103 RepID=UPI00326490EB
MIKQRTLKREDDKIMPTNLFKIFVLGVLVFALNRYCKNRNTCVVYQNELLHNENITKNLNLNPSDGQIIKLSEIDLDDDFQPVNMALVTTQANAVSDKVTEFYKKPIEE